jgi:dTDP-4-dehydrorhamnose reductase
MRIIITGATGVLGSYLVNYFKNNKYKIFTIGNKKKAHFNLDLNNKKKLFKIVKKINPDCIINCVALTNVDLCEKNFHKSYLSNTLTVSSLLESVKTLKKKPHLIHISTDQLYNGLLKKKNSEKKIQLINNYSLCKYLGELELKKYQKKTIIRTNFYGKSISTFRKTFSEYIITKLKKRKKIFLASNIYFNPIEIYNLSIIIKKIIEKKIFGLYNIGNKRIFTKYSFGLYIAKKNNLKKSFIYRFKSKVSIHKRPLNTIMSNKKIEKKLCIKIN